MKFPACLNCNDTGLMSVAVSYTSSRGTSAPQRGKVSCPECPRGYFHNTEMRIPFDEWMLTCQDKLHQKFTKKKRMEKFTVVQKAPYEQCRMVEHDQFLEVRVGLNVFQKIKMGSRDYPWMTIHEGFKLSVCGVMVEYDYEGKE